jgi:hypothetical protein
MKIQFEIPGLPKTTNSIGRAHWSVKAKEARKWKELAGLKLMSLITPELREMLPLKKAKITFTRCSASECDYDGIVSSCKHLLDGIVACGFLENDKWSNTGVPVYQLEKAPRGSGKVKVEIEVDV